MSYDRGVKMSMPKLPEPDTILTKEQAINAILTSIALEETALSHIITAESEKIKYVLSCVKNDKCTDIGMLLKVNESAANMLDRVNDMQIILKNKLRLACNCLPECPHPKPCPPCPPVPPKPPCTTILLASTAYPWQGCSALDLEKKHCCDNGVEVQRHEGVTFVLLPASRKYKIEIVLELHSKSESCITIEVKVASGNEVIYLKEHMYRDDKQHIELSSVFEPETPHRKASKLSIRLLSVDSLKILRGKVSITEVVR